MGVVPGWLHAKFQENPFLQSLWLAPLILTIFYYIGTVMEKVEKMHKAWVEQQNARDAALREAKDQ